MVIYVPPVKEVKFTLMKVNGGGGGGGGDIPLHCCSLYSPPDNHTLTGNKALLIVWPTILMID